MRGGYESDMGNPTSSRARGLIQVLHPKTKMARAEPSDRVRFQQSPVAAARHDDPAKFKLLASHPRAIPFQVVRRERRLPEHMIAQPLNYAVIGLRSSSDMRDPVSSILDDIDASTPFALPEIAETFAAPRR
jgi:hypothetical protein